MNFFNRLVMLIVALLLVAVPVALLLVHFELLSADLIDTYIRYRGGLDALGNLSLSSFGSRVRIITGIVGVLVALVAVLLILRELNPGQRTVRSTVIENVPGKEVMLTARAVRSLAEAAALEVGAIEPSASLRSRRRRYRVLCGVRAPASSNRRQLAARAKDNIRRALEEQNVSVRDVQVTVQGTVA